VPVIALTGHLGAGKTTLLNHFLSRPGGRVGVVVNDFGAINVDAALVTGQVDQVGSIAGGCVCCLDDTDQLDDALAQLTHPRLGLDAVVVEASGLAEPGALAWMIRHSGAEHVRPGGVVDVVDAVHYFDTVDDGGTPPARFAVASLVIVNKCDLLPDVAREDTLRRIGERVRAANPHAHVVHTSRGRVDPALLFDVASDEDPVDELPLAALARAERSGHHEGHGAHDHAVSVSVESRGAVDPAAVLDLLEDPPYGAYRLKGAVAVDTASATRGYVVHVVGRQVHVARSPRPPEANVLVAIGADLDRDAVRLRLERALTPAGRAGSTELRRLERLRRASE
jgi:G3E family GTPase